MLRPASVSRQIRNRRGMLSISTLMVLLLVMVLGVGSGWAYMTGRFTFGKSKPTRYVTERVKRGPLEVSITERGSLDSAANVTLVSKVEGATTIIRIVEEGTTAKEGEVLVELDSSKLRDQETQQRIVVEQADAALKQAIEKRAIQITQNESDINAADLKLLLAKLDLEQYERGDYTKELNDLEGKRTLAQEELKRAEESYEFQKENAKKGYVSQSALEAARISKVQKELALEVARKAVDVLTTYSYKRQIAEKKANSIEFAAELERVKRKASAAMAQADADLSSCKLTAEVEQSKLAKLREQIANCTLRAPQDGEVVYANVQNGRGGNDQATIMEGASVRERQAIINLPDFSRMQVNAKIHESRIGYVREGLRCLVRTEANHGEVFNGVVHTVSSVPLSGNWPNRDLKEYAAVIRMTDPVEKVRKLKPGLSAEVEIKVDYIPNCLYVPVQAIITIGPKRYAFPVVDGQLEVREVVVGKTNDIVVEVKEGLNDSERVVMNPRTAAPTEIARLEDAARVEEERRKAEAPAEASEPVSPGTSPGASPGGPNFAGGGTAGGAGGRRGPGGAPGPVDAAGGATPAAGGPGAGGPGAGGGGPGAGGPGGGGFSPDAMFTRFDKDADGFLKGDEINERLKDRLAEIDTDKDGAISKAEMTSSVARRGGGGGGGGPRGVAPASGNGGGGQ